MDGEFTPFYIQTIEGHRIVEVGDIEYQRRRAAVAVRIGQRVGEVLNARATTVQVDEIRVVGVQRVGVGPVSRQHQRTVGADERTGGDRAGRHSVGALHIVGQHVAGQCGLLLGRDRRVAVVQGFGRVVDNVHVDAANGTAAIAVGRYDRKAFAHTVGAISIGMRLVVGQGVAVADDASGRVVAGHGQGIA